MLCQKKMKQNKIYQKLGKSKYQRDEEVMHPKCYMQKSSVMRTEKDLLDSTYMNTILLQKIDIIWVCQTKRDLLQEIPSL